MAYLRWEQDDVRFVKQTWNLHYMEFEYDARPNDLFCYANM